MENQVDSFGKQAQKIDQNTDTYPIATPKSNNLMIGTVALVCALIFGLGGYYLGSQSSRMNQSTSLNPTQSSSAPTISVDQITNWQTFSDKKYNFNLKLPIYYAIPVVANWSENAGVDYTSIDPMRDARLEDTSVFDIDGAHLIKSILIESSKHSSIEQWRKYSKFASSHKFIAEEVKGKTVKFTVLVSGLTDYVDNDRVTGFASYDGRNIIVVGIRHYANNQEETEIFIDQILSTFQFTNPTEETY